MEGSSAVFSVTASSSISMTYQWMKDGVDIPGATSKDFTLNNASKSDMGSYQVVVSNSVGSVTSNSADLAVNDAVEAPSITEQPDNLSILEGDAASFTVSVNGTAPFDYQWQKDGTDIAGANANTFSISNTSTNDAAVYRVIITNSAGSVTSNEATLTVDQVVIAPSISDHPDDITVAEGQDASFAVSALGTGPLSYQWQKDGIDISGAVSSRYEISNVTESNGGKYRVLISNSMGAVSSQTAELSVLSSPPINVSAEVTPAICEGSNGSIILTVTGGTAPYRYNWSNGANSKDITDLDPGSYNVTILDAADNAFNGQFTIDQVIEDPVVTSEIVHASCLNNDGSISLTSSTSANYSYQWDHGPAGPELKTWKQVIIL